MQFKNLFENIVTNIDQASWFFEAVVLINPITGSVSWHFEPYCCANNRISFINLY